MDSNKNYKNDIPLCVELLELLCDLYEFNIENEKDNLENELDSILRKYGERKYKKNKDNNLMKWINAIRKLIDSIKDNIDNEMGEDKLNTLMNNVTKEINDMQAENRLVATIYGLIYDIIDERTSVIEIRHPKQRLQKSLTADYRQYLYNWRLIVALTVCIGNIVAYNFPYFPWLSIGYGILVVVIGSSFLIYGACFFKNDEEKNDKDGYKSPPLVNYFNYILYKSAEPDLYTNDIRFPIGVVLIGVIIYSCCVTILTYFAVFPYDFDYDACADVDGDNLILGKGQRSGCLLGTNSNVNVYSFVLCFSQLIFMRDMEGDFKNAIEKIENGILNRYPCTRRYKKCVEKELEAFKEWQQLGTKDWFKNNVCQIFTIFVLSLIYHVIVYGVSRHNIYNFGYYNSGAVVICHIMYVLDSMVFTALVLTCAYIIKQYQFPSVIMEALSHSLEDTVIEYCKKHKRSNINQVIGWWVLREYYIDCLIHYYCSSFSQFIAVGVSGSIILVTFAFSGDWAIEVFWTFVVGLGLALTATILFAQNSVRYIGQQRAHLATLNKVKLQFRWTIDDSEHFNKIDDIFRFIAYDVETTLYSLTVFGIAINEKFMLALRASTSGIAIAVLTEIS